MSTHESQLKSDLQALHESFRELSLRLAETAGNLGRSGRPPSEEVLQQLEGAHRRFRELQEAAFQLATGEHLTPPISADRVSVPDLLALLRQVDDVRAVRKKNQEQMQKARTVLDRILSIVHKDSATFAPLADLHAKAASLREASATIISELTPMVFVIAFSVNLTVCRFVSIGSSAGKPLIRSSTCSAVNGETGRLACL